MTDDVPDDVLEDGALWVDVIEVPRPRFDRTIKLLLALTACFTSIALVAQQVYTAPAAKSNADAVKSLAVATATEKAQDACYDLYSADVTDGNAEVLAANTAGDIVERSLVVALATQPRNPDTVAAILTAIGETDKAGKAAVATYNAAIEARKAYVTAGRPLPCDNLPN